MLALELITLDACNLLALQSLSAVKFLVRSPPMIGNLAEGCVLHGCTAGARLLSVTKP